MDNKKTMNVLSLFTGAGGGELTFQHLLKGFRTVGYVEYEPYPQAVIRQRISDGLLDNAPIFSDIKNFISEGWAESYKGMVDVVTGGFPCQDISCAGKGAGIEGEKSGLWGEMAEVVRQVRPQYVFVENSPMLTVRGLGTVLKDLAEMGYDARWGCISAAQIGAPHKRNRIWIVAYTKSGIVSRGSSKKNSSGYCNGNNLSKEWNNARGLFGEDYMDFILPKTAKGESQSKFCLVVDGMAGQVGQLKAIGNGQVPQVAATAWEILMREYEPELSDAELEKEFENI